jgi:hypothetical protein
MCVHIDNVTRSPTNHDGGLAMTEALTLTASCSHRSMCTSLPRALCATSYNVSHPLPFHSRFKILVKQFFFPQSHTNVCLSFHVSTLLLWFASACLCVCLADLLQSSRIKRSAVQLYHINTHGNTHVRTCLPPCSTGGAGGRHPAVPHTAQPRAALGSGAAQGATHSHHLLTGLLL